MKRQNKKNTKAKGARAPAQPRQVARSTNRGNMPASYVRTQTTRGMTVERQGAGTIVVKNREYLTDLAGTAIFTAKSYALNPGLSTSFAWLANIANNYEMYQFKKLDIEYEPSCGTTTFGSVSLALDFDVLDSVPENKARLMTFLGAKTTAPYRPFRVSALAANIRKATMTRYTRPGSAPANSDLKTYDVANLIVATSGFQANDTALGSLYLDYVVELQIPHSPAVYPWENSGTLTTAISTKADPLNGAYALNADPATPTVAIQNSTNFLLKKAGEYIVDATFGGTGLTSVDPRQIFVAHGSGQVAQGAYVTDPISTTNNSSVYIKTIDDNTLVSINVPNAWTTLANLAIKIAPFAWALHA